MLLQPRTILLSGLTPGMLPLDDVPVQVVDLAMLILVKAIALQDRRRKHARDSAGDKHRLQAAKHAYDISECLRRYPGKMEALAERLGSLWLAQSGPEQPLIDDALECLRAHFASPTAEGPRWECSCPFRRLHSASNIRAEFHNAGLFFFWFAL